MNPEIVNCLSTLRESPRDPQALKNLEEVLRSASGTPSSEVLDALEKSLEHHRCFGDWEAVVGLINGLINLRLGESTDQARQLELLGLKGRVLEEELLEEDAALQAYQAILDIQPDNAQALETVEHIQLIRENWQRVARKFADEAEAVADSDRQLATSLFLSAAEVVCRNDRDDTQVEHYLRRSLQVEPRNTKAGAHLERLLRRNECFDELAELYEQQADVATTREERVRAFLAAGDLWAKDLQDPGEAALRYQRAASLDPTNPKALRCLVQALTAKQDWAGLLRFYEEALRSRSQGGQELHLLVQMGTLCHEKLQQVDQAEEYFRRVRKLDPKHPVMLEFYRSYYRQRGEAAKILALLDSAQRAESEPRRRLELTKEMAMVAEIEVENLEKAIDIWKSIQRMDPNAAEAVVALKRLYRQTQPPKWNALRELIKDEIESLSDQQVDKKIERLLEVVEIYRDHLKLDVMVINTYNAILALKPDHAEAIDALTEKYEALGRWNDLIGLLQRRKDALGDRSEKIRSLHRIATLWTERFGNQSQAITPLLEVLELDPAEPEATAKLREIYKKRRSWRELMELYRREVAHLKGVERRQRFKEMAQLAADKLGEPKEGIQVWNQVLEEEDLADEEALNELALLYRREERWPALAEVLHRQVEAPRQDPARTVEILEQLGELYTNRVRAPENAIEVWRKVLALRPDSVKARGLLRELYVQDKRWDELEGLFATREEFSELAETLAAAADRTSERELKIQLYARVGHICRDRLEHPERAIKALERVMAIDPQNVQAAGLLVPLYRQSERWGRLLSTFEVLLEQARDTREKLEHIKHIQELYETHLESKHLAYQWSARAYNLAPDDSHVRAEMERLAAESESWEELVQVYVDRLPTIADASAKVAMLRHLAQLCTEKLHRPEDAEVFYRELLEVDANDLPSLEALEQIYSATQRWDGLVDIYRRRAVLESESEQKQAFLFKVVFIQEERLGDPVAAIETLQELLAIERTNLRALRSLARLYDVRGEWFPLVETLQRQLELVSERPERIELLFRLGIILEGKLGATEEGLDALGQVLSLDPLHRGAVQAIEHYLTADSPHRRFAARTLQPFYERSEDWPRLLQAIELLLEGESDETERVALWRRVMALEERRFNNSGAAFTAGAHVLKANPEDRELRQQMMRLAEAVDRHGDLAGLLAEAIEALSQAQPNPELEVALSWELSVLLDDQLARPEETEPYLRRIVELNPQHREAFELLERVLREGGKWSELRELLMRRRELTNDSAAIRDILLQISALNENVLEDIPAAITAYEEVLSLEPSNPQALRSLERHYADQQRWQDLFELYRRQLDMATDLAATNQLKLRQAELLGARLEDCAAATALLEEIVAADPWLDAAVSLLEQLMAQHEDLRRRITEILEPVFERREAWGNLVNILLQRRALTTDRFEAVELLCRAAALQEERLSDPHAAFASLLAALALDPAATHVLEGSRRLAEQLGRWGEAAQAWEHAEASCEQSDLSLRGRLLAWVAEAHDVQLRDVAKARAVYERLIALDPENMETTRPAAAALARIYEQQGEWGALVSVLRRQLGWTEEAPQREEILLRIGQLQEQMLEIPAAMETYQALLEENSAFGEALDALERLYLANSRWPELVDIYRRRVELATATEERRNWLLRIATVYEEELGDIDQAVAAYLAVLDESPEELESLRALARIYRETSRWSDLLEMLEREQALMQDEELRIALLFEAATVEHRQLKEPGLAIDRYYRVLEIRRNHSGARRALEDLLEDRGHRPRVAELLMPIYREEGEWQRLAGVHDLLAESAEDPGVKVEHLREVARLSEEQLGDLERACEAYRRILGAGAGDATTLECLDPYLRTARSLRRWHEYIETLEATVPDLVGGEARLAVHLAVARASCGELDDVERALRHYREVLDIEPEHREALPALDELYQRKEDWSGLLEIVNRRVELAREPAEKQPLLVRAAVLCRDMLERPSDAIAAYEQVLALTPADPEAVRALDALYTTTERWVELAELLQRNLERCEEPGERAPLLYRLGRLHADRLHDPVQAVAAYQQVLALDPSHEAVVAALEGYLGDAELQAEAARILQPYYAARQDWSKLIHIYQIRLEAASEGEERLALSTRIAQLYEEQLEDLDGAFTWYSKVFLEKPADSAIRDQMLRLAGILERWTEVAEVLAKYLDQTLEESSTSRSAAMILGSIYDERLYQVDQAVACYRRVLDADRLDTEAFELMESLLTRAERWENLLDLYRETAEATSDLAARRELMLKVCRVWEEALDQPSSAIDAYRAVLDLYGNDQEAVAALDRLYTATERWHDLAELLIRQVEMVASPQEALELECRLGLIYELRLEDLPAAIDYYEVVLKQHPDHAKAIAALERLILDRDQRYRIARILEPIYKAQDEWAKLVVIYDAQLDFVDEPARRGFLLREIARLHEERGGSLELAFGALSRAFKEEFGDPELLARLEHLAEQLRNWDGVVEVLRQGVADVYDNDLLVRIHSKIATLLEERLGDPHGAVDAWRQVLAAREENPEAIQQLSRLLGALERYEELVEVLQRKAEMSQDLQVQKATYYQIAEIWDVRLQRPERAVEIYRQVLSLDDRDQTALDALDRLYRLAENWMDLIWVYRRKIDIAEDSSERRRLQLMVATVYDEKLADNFEAITAYREVLDQAAPDRDVLDALDRLLLQEGLHSDLLEILELKIAHENDLQRKNELVHRSAQLMELQLGNIDGAIARYRQVLQADRTHGEALAALRRLVMDESHRETVADILEQHYQTVNERGALVEILELRLELLAEPRARCELLVRIGKLCEEALRDPQAAFTAYTRAFGEVPGDEQVQQLLEQVVGQLGALPRLVEVYESRLDAIYDTALARRLHLKIARLADESLSDQPRAERHYRAALDIDGHDAQVLEALDRVLHRQQKWPELVEVIEREVEIVSDPHAQAELYFRAGEIKLQQHEDLDGAFAAFRCALEREAAHRGAQEALEKLLATESYRVAVLDVLEPLHERNGNHAKVVELLEIRLSTVVDPLDRTALLERIARIYEEQLNAKEDALGALGRAMAEDPANAHIVDEAERLARALSRFGELVTLADELLATEMMVDSARALGLRAARWHRVELGDLAKAEQVLRKVLGVDPSCVEALCSLEEICRANNASADLAWVLARRAELELDSARRRVLLVELARLQAVTLGKPEGAVAAWRGVLDQDPNDAEALRALAGLYQSMESWEELLEILDRQAQQSSQLAEQVAYRHRIGELVLERMQDLGRAVEVYRDILTADPTDQRALVALEGIHERREDWAALQEVLLWRLEQLAGTDRIPVFRRLVENSLQRLNALDEGVGYLQQIMALDPADVAALELLESTLTRGERWYDLVDALRKHAELRGSQGDTAGEIAQLVKVARVWNEQLENPEAASEVLEQILQRDPKNIIALTGLARLYESTEQWDKCRDALERAGALGPAPSEQAELEFRMGRVKLAQGQDEEAAAAHYRRALECDPRHRDALAASEAYARKREEWDKVAAVLELKLALPELERAERLTSLVELGLLYASKLQQASRGVTLLEQARQLDGDNLEVLSALSDAYYAADRLAEAEPLLQHLIELAGTKQRKATAQYICRLGAIAEKRGDLELARQHFDKAHKLDSSSLATLVALGRIYMQQKDWENARRVYRSMLLQNLDEGAGITKADVFLHLGRIHAALGEDAKAKSMYERGLEVDPNHPQLGAAMRELKG